VLDVVEEDGPIVFPAHPRTRAAIDRFGLSERVASLRGLRMVEPVGYLDFLKLMASARVVLTDSGGIQEETTILGVPCLTLRENTERPITAEVGTNRIVGQEPERILAAYREVRGGAATAGQVPPLWDGHAAERILQILRKAL
jgi:UDP-N-acetylglucosamine 2-epimerase (non-hydrolysing)